MILNLTDISEEPLQGQIYRQIRAKILNGELEAGEMLPSIRGLAKDQKVSVITVQRGYEILERENLIVSRRGKGFFVSDVKDNTKKNMSKEKLIENVEPLIKIALEEGLTQDEIFEILKQLLGEKENNNL